MTPCPLVRSVRSVRPALRAAAALAAVVTTVLLGILPSACSFGGFPGGECDEYDEGHRRFTSSCTPDGKVSITKDVGCGGDGPISATTVTACGADERCVEGAVFVYENNYNTYSAACLRTCVDDTECQLTDASWCRTGVCVAPLRGGDDCSDQSRCASGLSCLPEDSAQSDASTVSTDGSAEGSSSSEAGADRGLPCADGASRVHVCKCR